ncbi:MAG TPA: hypothetical protein VHM19_09295, partial [Polyangiales bacterium]|nr:hypothetical protein [Polyangiales bacterium]
RLKIVQPCEVAWETMQGSEARRFCGSCRKHVHNLSALTQREAERLLNAAPRDLCARYELDKAGHVKFRRESAAPRDLRSFVLSAVTATTLSACSCEWDPGRPRHSSQALQSGEDAGTPATQTTAPTLPPTPAGASGIGGEGIDDLDTHSVIMGKIAMPEYDSVDAPDAGPREILY